MCVLKIKFLASVVQKLYLEQGHRQTHIDRQDWKYYLSAYLQVAIRHNSFRVEAFCSFSLRTHQFG